MSNIIQADYGILSADNYYLRKEANVLGAKNLLPMDVAYLKSINTAGTWSGNTYTRHGVSFTVNTDGTVDVSISGTSSAMAWFTLQENSAPFTNPLGYRLNGSVTYNVAVSIRDLISGDSSWRKTVTVREGGDEIYIPTPNATRQNISITVEAGSTSADNCIVKPMIRLASDLDSTYEPYAMTNRELTDRVKTYVKEVTFTYANFGVWTANLELDEYIIATHQNYLINGGISNNGAVYHNYRISSKNAQGADWEDVPISPNTLSIFCIVGKL